MKMHHLEEDEVKAIMEKVKTAVGEKELNTDKVEEIFELSKVFELSNLRSDFGFFSFFTSKYFSSKVFLSEL